MQKGLLGIFAVFALTLSLFAAGCGSSSSSTPAAVPDTTAPTVASTSPAADATDVVLNTMITVTFSESLDATTVDGATLTLLADGETDPVMATVSYSDGMYKVECDPNYQLATDTLYHATLTATVADLAGNMLAEELTWSFTTTATDLSPPGIAETFPPDGGYATPGADLIYARYTERGVNATNASFTLTCDGSAVAGADDFDEAAFFHLAAPFSTELSCTANISATLTDGDGNPADVSETWSFSVDTPVMTGTPVLSSSSVNTGGAVDFTIPVNGAAACFDAYLTLDGSSLLAYTSDCEENTGDTELTGTFDLSSVPPGDYTIVVTVIDSTYSFGNWYRIDTTVSTVNYTNYDSFDPTLDEDSGIPFATVTVLPVPDLTVEILSVVDNTTSANVNFEVCNDGYADADAFDVSVFLSPATTPQPGDTPDGVAQISSLSTSSCSTGSVTVPEGSFIYEVFYAVADLEQAITEMNEDNNSDQFVIRDSGETFVSTDVPQAIIDNTTTYSSLSVSSSSTALLGIIVTLDITHTWDSDLEISLTSPSGTTITLSSDNGWNSTNYTGTVFDDFADTPITSGSAPFTGSYIPEEPLSTFAGEDPDGTWTLEVHDQWPTDQGTLNSWSITIW